MLVQLLNTLTGTQSVVPGANNFSKIFSPEDLCKTRFSSSMSFISDGNG